MVGRQWWSHLDGAGLVYTAEDGTGCARPRWREVPTGGARGRRKARAQGRCLRGYKGRSVNLVAKVAETNDASKQNKAADAAT